MRRWNGWGMLSTEYPLPAGGMHFLQQTIGPGISQQEVSLAATLAHVPPSRLPEHPLVSADPHERLLHARGQSMPDWIALKYGAIATFPDGVAYPQCDDDARSLLIFAQSQGAHVIPFGGGTSVVGHINPQAGDAPVLTIDMSHMNSLIDFDSESQLATFGAGIRGPDLEAILRSHGYMLGHYPQSFELSTLGGWVAARSSGQQSLGYGRIEQIFAGGHIETPVGPLDIPLFPASAAGPDLREVVMGSEGRLGIITRATVRITPIPAQERYRAIVFPDWQCGYTAARMMVQARLPLTMLRLSTPAETATNLALAGHERAVQTLEKLLSLRGAGSQKCMLLYAAAGDAQTVRKATHDVLSIARKHHGISLGSYFGTQWRQHRFRAPYLRNTLWPLGYAVDTLETATTWDNVERMAAAIEDALHAALTSDDERVHVFTHLSHFYPHGASIYTTYVFRLGVDAGTSLSRWQRLKAAASEAVVRMHGTISHQHGIGIDHAPYLAAEKGEVGMQILQSLFAATDPQGLMNPGKLVLSEQRSVEV